MTLSIRLLGFCAAIAVSGASTAVSGASIVVNGGFETPANTPSGGFVTYFGGQSFPGWLVGGDSVDVHNTGHTAAHSGIQSLDLSGNAAGSISQQLSVLPASQYLLDFWYAAHVYHPYSGNAFAEVWWGSLLVDTLSLPQSVDPQNMNWNHAQYQLAESGNTETLSFVSLSPNGGIILDDISLSLVVPEPSAFVLATFVLLSVFILPGRIKRHQSLPTQ